MFLSLNILSLGIIDISMIIIWAIIAIVAIIVEFETTSLTSIWFGIGAVGGIIAVLLGLPEWSQFLIFVGVSGICVVATRPFVKKISDNQTIPTNVDKLIGMTAVVTKEIVSGEKGEVKVEYKIWPAVSLKDKIYNVGEKVIIKEINGNKLVIDNIEEISL